MDLSQFFNIQFINTTPGHHDFLGFNRIFINHNFLLKLWERLVKTPLFGFYYPGL